MQEGEENKIDESSNKIVEPTTTEIQKEVSTIDDNFIEDVFKSNYIDLYKLEGLDVKDQSRVFSLVLTDIYKDYNDVDYSSIRKSALKCLKLSCDPDDNLLRLPYKLMVNKDGNRMYFKFEDDTKKNAWLLIIILGLFIFAALASTYVALRYLSIADLNIDIDGDGIADLNIDLSGNEKAEINISNDRKTPSVNVDYKGNRKATFNIDTDNSGTATGNLIDQKNDEGVCTLNCDVNGDGWPDINIDIDGDGKADLYLDTDGDGKADLNFDTNGDGTCDLHCDTDDDGICDEYCVKNVEVIENNTGSSAAVGNSGTDVETAQFIVDFVDSKLIVIDNLFPEDQSSNEVLKSATKKIIITNKSTTYTRYKVEMVVTKYTFTSDNFQYKIVGTNGGFNQDFITVPKETSIIFDQIAIAPGTTQSYTFTFKLKGINANQNFDQGKSFDGYFQVYLVDSTQ